MQPIACCEAEDLRHEHGCLCCGGPAVCLCYSSRDILCPEAAGKGTRGAQVFRPPSLLLRPDSDGGACIFPELEGPWCRLCGWIAGAFLEGAPRRQHGRKLCWRSGALDKWPAGSVFKRHLESLGRCLVCVWACQRACLLAGRWPHLSANLRLFFLLSEIRVSRTTQQSCTSFLLLNHIHTPLWEHHAARSSPGNETRQAELRGVGEARVT